MKTLYFDYSATTPVDPRVAAKMIPYLTEEFGNPASRSHPYGWTADKAVEEARANVAALVGADPKEIVFTSGATESNNLAIKGAGHFYAGTKGKHIITVRTEHKAVLDTVREMERQGFEATYLGVKENGLLDLDVLRAAIRPDAHGRAVACRRAVRRVRCRGLQPRGPHGARDDAHPRDPGRPPPARGRGRRGRRDRVLAGRPHSAR